MIQLTKTKEVLHAALAGQLFDVPEGDPRELLFYLGEVPEKRRQGTKDDDTAYCFILPGSFSLGKVARSQQVTAHFVLYERGTAEDGLQMVSDLVQRLEDIPGKLFSPCSLKGDISGSFEEIEHPHYRFSLTFNFTTAGGGI